MKGASEMTTPSTAPVVTPAPGARVAQELRNVGGVITFLGVIGGAIMLALAGVMLAEFNAPVSPITLAAWGVAIALSAWWSGAICRGLAALIEK